MSRQCASKRWCRYLELGIDGLHDRSSQHPALADTYTSANGGEDRPGAAPGQDRTGRIAARLDLPASTVYRVLCRHDLNRLRHLDRQTAAPIRRYQRGRPGRLHEEIGVDLSQPIAVDEAPGWAIYVSEVLPEVPIQPDGEHDRYQGQPTAAAVGRCFPVSVGESIVRAMAELR